MAGLTWLHLSDWHQKGMEFDRKVIRNALIEDIENRKEIDPNLSKIDFIIFSGDVAFSGKQEEYLGAREELFEPLLKATGLNPDRLFIAPGNHDLDRNELYLVPCAISQPLKSEIEVQEWLTNDRKRSKLLEPFRPFSNFVESFTGHKQADFANIHRIKVGDRDIAVLCMNSSWMCGRKNDSGVINDKDFVLVGEPQILFPLSEISNADLKIAVLHHPFDWLAEFDRNRIERRLMQECNFVLRGHQHKPQIDVIHSTLGDCIIIPAGACYNRRIADNPLYINSYNFVNFNFDTNKGIVFLRRWSESKSSWTEDTDSCNNGKFGFTLPQSNSMKSKKRNSAIGLGNTNIHAPYIGLSSFSENESSIFFGRRVLIGMMENQLRCDPRFLAVVGSSGSGKSSVVQAGLLPIIRRGKLLGFEDVHIISFRPGFNPHDALRQALKAEGSQKDVWRDLQKYKENWPGKRLVIFIDQFEELFTYSEDKRKKGLDFLEGLSRILRTGSITLLIAIRADFLNSLLSSPLRDYIQTGQINVISMKEDEIREAIFKPAQAIGLTIEPGLDDRIIGDLRGHEDQLPLLEHALYQLWIRGAKGGLLTHKDYSRIGGVSGAVSQWANAAFEKLNPAEQKLSKRIFTRLIQYGKDFNSDRRIQIFSSEIDTFGNEETVNKLIKSLADSRLLVTDYDSSTGSQTIEIIHEALIREWQLLRTWIDEEREFLLWRQMLDGKIIEWVSRGYEEFCFLDGSFLEEAKDWLKRKPDDFNQREMQYISASIDRNKKREERVIKDIEAAIRAEDFNLLEHLYVEASMKHGKERDKERLNESWQHHESLEEDQNYLICRYLLDGTISFANGEFCTFFSLNTDDPKGEKIDYHIFNEEIKSANGLKYLLTADHPSITYECRMNMPQGLRWLRWTTRGIFDEFGSLIEVQSIGRDITSTKRTEEALRESQQLMSNIISFLPDPIMAIDFNGKVMIWNVAMQVLTGVMAKDILGRGDYEYSIPFYGYKRPILVDMVLEPHEDWEAEYFGFKREGAAVIGEVYIPTFGPHGSYLLEKATALYDDEGNIVGAIQSVQDTTGRRLMEQKLERSRTELHVAAEIQRSFIPKKTPDIPNFEVAAVTIPAMEVGGDFYDFIHMPDGNIGLVIADVAGKSIPAALFMALSRMIIRASAAHQSQATEVLKNANNMIASDATAGMFVTLLFGVLDGRALTLKYASAGHPTPLQFKSRDCKYIGEEASGIALGVKEDAVYEERTIKFDPGDVAVFYTDGVTEAMNPQGELYGLKRLMEAVSKTCQSSPEEIMGRMLEDISTFRGDQEQNDDITLVVLKARGDDRILKDIDIDSKDEEILRVIEELEMTMSRAGFARKEILDMQLAVEEACINIIRHGYRGMIGTIHIAIDVSDDALTVTIEDNAPPFDPTQFEKEDFAADLEKQPMDGLGIHLMRSLSDEMRYEYENGKNKITFIKMHKLDSLLNLGL